MITATQAFQTIMAQLLPIRTVRVELCNSLHKTLAEDILADRDHPPFDRIAMDGIAVNSKFLSINAQFKILATVCAGEVSSELPDGPVCFEVMTGAPLPKNADRVIKYEDLQIKDGLAEVVVEQKALKTNIHKQGSDYLKNDLVISKGTYITSPVTALLASVGAFKIEVSDLPKVAILSTGNELVDIHEVPQPQQIRWSNGLSLKHELFAFGLSEVSLLKARDSKSEIKTAIQTLLESHDVLILTGGVSAGKLDFVPEILQECGVIQLFHKVSQRPGKPLWFGKTSQKLVFGLPGNPVSCLINLRKYVIPCLVQSAFEKTFQPVGACLATEINAPNNMTFYCPVKLKNEQGKIIAYPIFGNGSGDFFQLRDSDGFVELSPEKKPFLKDSLVEVFFWGNKIGGNRC